MKRLFYSAIATLLICLPVVPRAGNAPQVVDELSVKCGTPQMLESLANGAAKTATTIYRSIGMEHNELSDGGHFRVHYNTTGGDAVDVTDNDFNTIPDYVDSCLIYLEYAYDLLMDIGFQPPIPDNGAGGGDEIDVYLQNLNYYGVTNQSQPTSSYTSSAYMEIENDFAESIFSTKGFDALKVTTAHEFFHTVQFRHNYDYDLNWWQEQSAVWFENYAWDGVNDYYYYLKFFFSDYIQSYSPRNTPLDDNWNSTYKYGAAVFPMYLAKKHGPEIIYDIWKHMGDQRSNRIAEFNSVIPGGLSQALIEFAVWNYFTYDRGNSDDFYPDSPDFPVRINMDGSTSIITGTGSYSATRLTSKYQEIILSDTVTDTDWLRVTFNSLSGSFANAVVLYNSPTDYRIHLFDYPSEDVPLAGTWQKALLISSSTNTTGSGFTYTYQTSVVTDTTDQTPLVFSLQGVYPNPFNPSTTVAFTVPDAGGMVAVRVYNALGQEVSILHDGYLSGGEKHLLWKPGSDLAGGMYFVRVTGPWGVKATKMLFLK